MAFVDEIDVIRPEVAPFWRILPKPLRAMADDYMILSISPGNSGHDSRGLWVVSSSDCRSDPFLSGSNANEK